MFVAAQAPSSPRPSAASPTRAYGASLATAIALVALVALFALQIRASDRATYAQANHRPSPVTDARQQHLDLAESLALPYPIRTAVLGPRAADRALAYGFGAAETAVLIGLALALRRRAPSRAIVAAAACAGIGLAAIGLAARTLGSADSYAYVAYARVGLHGSYAPAAGALAGEYRAIVPIWGEPLIPSVYGPAWFALQHAVTGNLASLGDAIAATRWIGLASVAAFGAMLLASRLPRRLAVLALANPAIYTSFVADAHNDLVGIDFVFAALVLAERMPLAAAALVTVAGLLKLPLAIFALAAFRHEPPVRRALWIAGTAAAVVALSALLGGHGYVADVVARGTRDHGARQSRLGTLLISATGGFALLGLAYTALRSKPLRGAAFGAVELGFAMPQPWYYAWGFAYAALDPWTLEVMLVAAPLLVGTLDSSFFSPAGRLGMALCLATGVALAVSSRRGASGSSPAALRSAPGSSSATR